MEVVPLERWRWCLSSRWMQEALFSMRKDEEDKRREEGMSWQVSRQWRELCLPIPRAAPSIFTTITSPSPPSSPPSPQSLPAPAPS